LLDARAEAIRTRDRAAFAATLASTSSPFGRRQLRLFDNLDAVPLAAYRLEARWDAYGDLARPSDAARYPDATRVLLPLTKLIYRLDGPDRRDVHQDAFFTFVEQRGEWAIANDADVADLGFYTARNLWDTGPVSVTTTGNFTVVTPACPEEYCGVAPVVLPAAARARRAVLRYWRRPWPKKVAIVAPEDNDVLARIIEATYPVENYVAFAYWTVEEGEPSGARIIVNAPRFATSSAERVEAILVHELMHLAALPSSGPFVPNFVEEGLAQYVAYDADPSAVAIADAAARAGAEVPPNYRFFLGDPRVVYDSYLESLSAIAYFIERWGFRTFERFYARLGRVGAGAGTARFHLDGALEATIGMRLRGFERAWASSIGA